MRSLDLAIIALYAFAMLAIGRYYKLRVQTADDYLLGGRTMSPLMIGLSLFATLTSTLSYLAYPGEMIKNGPMMFAQTLGFPVAYLIVGWVLIPQFMQHQPPPADAAAKLSSDLYGTLTYEDDFTTKRWQHLGRLDVGHPSHGGYRDRGFWVGMKGGFATSTQLVQRISSPQPLKQLVVTADFSANGPNLGGSITLSVGPRGEKPKWDVQTQRVHNGHLRLEVPAGERGSLQDFDVHVTLHSNSGDENGDKACVTLSKLTIQAKGE